MYSVLLYSPVLDRALEPGKSPEFQTQITFSDSMENPFDVGIDGGLENQRKHHQTGSDP
jgi:hypothetical protein